MRKKVENPLDILDLEENMNALIDTAAGNVDPDGQINGGRYYAIWFALGCLWWITGCGGIYLWISESIYMHETLALVMFVLWMLVHVAGFIALIWRRNRGVKPNTRRNP